MQVTAKNVIQAKAAPFCRSNQHLNWGVLLVVLAAAVLVSSAVSAENAAIRFEQLSLDEGLSQVTILAIHEDSRGHLWFGTEDGLNRYDGTSFTVYRHDPSDPSSLPADYVRAIAEDSAGRLWLGTEGGGVARWDPVSDRFVRYRDDRDGAAPGLAGFAGS